MSWPRKTPQSEYFNGSPNLRIRLWDSIRLIRKNHALEHATLTIVTKRLNRKVRLIGYASLNGFFLIGNIPADTLEQATEEALDQLHGGKRDLAISPLCGTNLVMAGLVAGAASMFAGRGYHGWNKFSRMAVASMIAAIAAQPLGKLAQRHITTDADQADVTGIRVRQIGAGRFVGHYVEVLRS